MNRRNKQTGIWALIGLGTAAAAYFGYRALPADTKKNIGNKVQGAGQSIADKARELESLVKKNAKKKEQAITS
ncbi:hypothetical protein [Altibacter sp. HG106]|uniref:hypothetical protein n=1 Tax=Altibacter sp. HG106 TaxID=3023937 RepID=UPI0023508668|nr:hypothetical protein [Altibacter sp. HG106]MDC7993547.1 hypothetical protein [Altibacter sp. HG106]